MAFEEVRVYQRELELAVDVTPFNSSSHYEILVADSGGGTKVLATTWASGVLLFEPSSSQFAYGCIKHDSKNKWEYRLKGNSAEQPPAYAGQTWDVISITERIFRTVRVDF